jgi:cytochrome c5
LAPFATPFFIRRLAMKTLFAAALAIAAATSAQAADAGREVYSAVCMACHAPENVMVSSPKRGDNAEWQRRLSRAGSFSALAGNAMNGYEAMPPKGGRAELSRTQVEAAIRFMMQ